MRAHVLAVSLLAAACVHDVVLPDEQVTPECGNGIVEPGEACDVASPGCVACEIAPTWTCDRTGCTTTCGDGVVGDGPTCASPRRDTACDMTGYWAMRESTYLRETILGGVQVSSNWFFLRLEQRGDTFTVTEDIDCGILVTGSATVRYSPSGLRSILHANRMDGAGTHPARRGVSRAVASGCEVSLDRWYRVRGLAPEYLPPDFTARPPLDALVPLPKVRDPQGEERPEGALDPDGDGHPGFAFQIAGLAPGVRNSAQRDWKEWATPPGASAPPSAIDLVIPGAFDLQESVLHVSDCGGSCSLLATVARVAKDLTPKVALHFVGKSLDGPRTRIVAPKRPGADVNTDLAICANVRLLLPHDASHP